MTDPADPLHRTTVTEWVANLAVNGAVMPDDEWEQSLDELLENLKTAFNETRSNARAKFLDSILRTNEQENP